MYRLDADAALNSATDAVRNGGLAIAIHGPLILMLIELRCRLTVPSHPGVIILVTRPAEC